MLLYTAQARPEPTRDLGLSAPELYQSPFQKSALGLLRNQFQSIAFRVDFRSSCSTLS
jgi:hypothetical protein